MNSIPFLNGGTNIEVALRQAQREFFTTANGGRQNVPKIIIIITDGSSSGDPVTVAKKIRGTGIFTISVGIGSGIVHCCQSSSPYLNESTIVSS